MVGATGTNAGPASPLLLLRQPEALPCQTESFSSPLLLPLLLLSLSPCMRRAVSAVVLFRSSPFLCATPLSSLAFF